MITEGRDKKTALARIVVPALIGVALIIIWAVKTSPMSTPAVEHAGANSDYALNVSSIDLEALTQHHLPIIIDFGADSCDQCKRMAPVLAAVNGDMQGKALIKFVDVWQNPDAAAGFPIQVIPTQVFVTADGTPYVPSKNVGTEFQRHTRWGTDEHTFTVHLGELTEGEMRAILADMGAGG